MQTVARSRVLSLAIALTALLTGCVKRAPSLEETNAQMRSCGGGVLACLYPKLQERSLAAPSAAGDTVVRIFQTQSFAGTHIGRVERRRTGWSYVYKYLPEAASAAPVNVDSVLVPSALVDSLLETIRAHNYWRDASAQCNGIQLDGQSVTLEARIGAKYYTVKCAVSRSTSLPSDVAATLATFRVISSLAPARPRAP